MQQYITQAQTSETVKLQQRKRGRKNVHAFERVGSLIGGSLLAAIGVKRMSLPGALMAAVGGVLVHRGATGHCYAYEAFGINTADRDIERNPNAVMPIERGVKLMMMVRINRSPEELYRQWKDIQKLPTIMSHLESVYAVDDRHSHWIAKAPLGRHVEWDAEIINDKENEFIAWRSLPGADVPNTGSVHFKRAEGNATELKVYLKYDPPAGGAGAVLAKLFDENPEKQLREDLMRFKQRVEAEAKDAPHVTSYHPMSRGAPGGGSQST